MKPLRVLLASLLMASPAVAVTTGTLSGSTTIAYACDMTLPGDITMTQSSTSLASGTDTMPYAQNDGTDYSLSALTVTSPAGSPLAVGTITFIDKDAATVVTNSSEATSALGNIVGVESGTGSVTASITDTVLAAGDYTVSSTISCSETP